jgi:hypothetical protein
MKTMSINSEGDTHWYKDQKLHREDDLPAILYSDGHRSWYKNNELYRINGQAPAIGADGIKIWYVAGCYYTKNSVWNINEDIINRPTRQYKVV